jgi:hypothetical protein
VADLPPFRQPALDPGRFFHSFCDVRHLKRSLSWALLALMFAVALVPANGLMVFHEHDDHEHTAEHAGNILAWAETYHATHGHDAEGLHAHSIGWKQLQQSSAVRELGAPLLVTQIWLDALASFTPAVLSVDVPRASFAAKTVHAPPPLLRSMAFLI